MKITVRNDYLIFPVYTRATEKTLTFSQKGNKIFALDIKLDNVSPDFYAYIDVSLFKGESLEVAVVPEMPICFEESDEMRIENLYWESVRPQVHFTVKNGWMGAPEALLRKDGKYVLLYPYHPADTSSGSAHTGCAVSSDLLHWTELASPILPENDEAVSRGQARAVLENVRRLHALAERKDVVSLVDREGERKWVSFREDGRYLVGDVQGGVFAACQAEKTLCYGASVCSGVSFADPESGKVFHMAWDSCRTARFGGQMSVPMELSLEKDADSYALTVAPTEALETLYKNTNRYEKLALGTKTIPLADTAHLIRLQGALPKDGALTVSLFGRKWRVDFSENRICIGDSECPISVTGGALDLTVVADRLGLEIFADGGRIYTSCLGEDTFMDRNLLFMTLSCDVPYCADLLEIHSLESVW